MTFKIDTPSGVVRVQYGADRVRVLDQALTHAVSAAVASAYEHQRLWGNTNVVTSPVTVGLYLHSEITLVLRRPVGNPDLQVFMGREKHDVVAGLRGRTEMQLVHGELYELLAAGRHGDKRTPLEQMANVALSNLELADLFGTRRPVPPSIYPLGCYHPSVTDGGRCAVCDAAVRV